MTTYTIDTDKCNGSCRHVESVVSVPQALDILICGEQCPKHAHAEILLKCALTHIKKTQVTSETPEKLADTIDLITDALTNN